MSSRGSGRAGISAGVSSAKGVSVPGRRNRRRSGGSIPIALDEMNRDGQIAPGDQLLISGFGAGLTWGTTLWRW